MRTIKITIDTDKNAQLLTQMLKALKFVMSIEKEKGPASYTASLSDKNNFSFPVSNVSIHFGHTFSRDEIYDINGR